MKKPTILPTLEGTGIHYSRTTKAIAVIAVVVAILYLLSIEV